MDVINRNLPAIADDAKFEMNGNNIVSETLNSNCKSMDLESCKDTVLNGNNEFDDEGFTTPFEILAEFLSSLMLRDYKNAFHYCKLILQYEPENETVQEFYPLIEEKIKIESETCCSDEEEGDSENEGLNDSGEANGSTEYFSSTSSNDNADSGATSNSSFESDSEDDKV